MAQAPIDYTLPVLGVNPSQQMLQGMQVGQGLLDAREQGLQRAQAAQMRPLQMEAAQLGIRDAQRAEQAAIAQQQMQAAAAQSAAVRQAKLAEAQQRLASGSQSPAEIRAAIFQFPELAAPYKDSLANATTEEKQTRLSQASTGWSLLNAGKPNAAAVYYAEQADAYAKAGMAKEAEAMKRMGELVEQSPAAAQNQLAGFLVVNDDKWADNATKAGTMGAEVRKAEAGATQTEAQAKIADAQAETAFQKIAADLGLTRAQTAKYWADIQNDKRKTQLAEMEAADKAAGVEKGKPLEAAAVKEIAATQASLDGIDEILTRKKGVDTGPISGKQNTVAQILGIDDQEKSRMRAELGNAVNSMISTLSGANVPPEEFARIREGLPQFDDNDAAFVSKTLATRASVQRLLDRTLKANKAAGRDVSGFEATTEDAWSQLPKAG